MSAVAETTELARAERRHRVISLRAENVKRLRALDIDADPHVNIVGGRNRQGKTSTLDAIQYALAGARAIPESPVREGETRASVVLDLDGITVTREWYTTEDGEQKTKLTIKDKDGTVSRPQDLLDRLYKGIAFDPLEFMRAKPAEQAATLAKMVGYDLTAYAKKRAAIVEERRDANREVKRIKALLDKLPHHSGVTEESTNLTELMAELDARQEHNRAVERNEQEREHIAKRIADAKQEMAELAARHRALKEQVAELEADGEKVAALISAFQPADVDEIRKRIEDAGKVNKMIADNEAYAAARKELQVCEATAKQFDAKLTVLDDQRAEAIAAADLPVEGLAFDEAGVTYQGLPLDQASGAEALALSVAIGARINPEMPIMLVRDGSLLDDDSLSDLMDLAKKQDFQMWIERVGDGPECSVVIEDGARKEN